MKLDLMRRIKAAFDPPASSTRERSSPSSPDPTPHKEPDRERCPVPHPHAGRPRRRHLLHESGDLRDALRRRPRRRAGDARRARTVRGRGHRRRRRLRPDRRAAGRHPAPPRSRPRQRAGQPAQRPAGPQPGASTSSATTPCPTAPTTPSSSRTSPPWPATSREFVRTSESTDRARRPTPVDALGAAVGPPGAVATLILPADVSWSDGGVPVPVVDGVGHPTGTRCRPRSGRARRPRPPPSARASGPCAVHRRTGLLGSAARRRRRPGRLDRRRTPVRDVPGPPRAGRRAARRSSAWATWPSSPRCAWTASATWCSSTPSRRSPSSPTRASPATWCPRVAPSTGWPDRATTWSGAVEALADLVGTTPGAAPRQEAGRPGLPTGTADRPDRVPGARRAAARRAPSSPTRATRPGCSPRAPRRAHRPTTGCASPAGPSGRACPSPSGPRWPHRDRRVVALEADGSALYTLQAWWTMAREGLDVTTVILNNHSYAVLNMELDRVGAGTPGPRARDMLDLGRPDLDFVPARPGPRPPCGPGRRRPRSSPTNWAGPWPPRARAWSRRSSPASCRTARGWTAPRHPGQWILPARGHVRLRPGPASPCAIVVGLTRVELVTSAVSVGPSRIPTNASEQKRRSDVVPNIPGWPRIVADARWTRGGSGSRPEST